MQSDFDALKARISDMDKDELKSFQGKNCLFCQITRHKLPSMPVYEDEKVLAILDIRPANKGHILLVPKEHYTILPQIGKELLSHIFKITKKISQAIIYGLKADGTNIYVASGQVAGQSSEHALVHIIPRFKHDDLNTFALKQGDALETDLEKVRERLR